MAETVLIPVAKQILGKLGHLALEQIGLLWTLKREILKLQNTISTIQAVLLDAEEKQTHNHQVKDWLEKLSDVMYDADDLLDDFSTEARRQAMAEADGSSRRATSCWGMPKQLINELKMAHDIRAIREKLDDITKDKDRLHLEVRFEEAESSRETDSCPPTIVVGREDDKKNIIQLLLSSNFGAKLSVFPIVGIGGLGKTTLAQLVFDDYQVQAHFGIKVWVHVSQSFDVKVILEKMLQSITRQNVVRAQIRDVIEDKRFLVVLDDVWEETVESWESLGKYLTVGAHGSKVLVTTRSTRVAEVTNTRIAVPYQLEGLTLKESWNLLVNKALNGRTPQNPLVERIGVKILEKCYGVPLAVSSVSGILSSKNQETEWQRFLENDLGSIYGEENACVLTLKLSYNHLPPHMKRCFAYCKLFPKGHAFDVQMLVQLWAAQGYVESEDKGLDCFRTLWWRSFFQEVEMDELGNLSKCRMHDLMHDLADSVTGNRIQRISSLEDTAITSSTRHLALFKDENADRGQVPGNKFWELGNASKVRTLICGNYLSVEESERVLGKFKCLRVLVMLVQGSNASTALHCVGKLKHLRFLCFKCQRMESLPDSISNLLNLQVLKVNCYGLKELSRDIKHLTDLNHLHFDGVFMTHMPKGIGELKSLQKLPYFVVGKGHQVGGLDELKELNALHGELIISNLVNVESSRVSVSVLKNKPFLQMLTLDWGRVDYWGRMNDAADVVTRDDEEILEILCPHPNLKKLKVHGGYGGIKFPNWLSSITNLVELSLKDCKKCEYLPPLHQISFLKELRIVNCPQLKGIKHNNGGDDSNEPCFQCLAYLYIRDCPKLTQMPAFPSVEGDLALSYTSMKPLANTMKMRRRGSEIGVHCADEYTTKLYECECDDDGVHGYSSSHDASVQPLSKLTMLRIENNYDNFQSLWSDDDLNDNSLVSLQCLSLDCCGIGVKLPSSLCSSKSLTRIKIIYSDFVEYLPPLHELPALNELSLKHCPKLKGCWRKKNNDDDDDDDDEEENWPYFHCLSSLEIDHCPNLTHLPLFPTVQGILLWSDTSAQPLVRTMSMKTTASSSSSRPRNELIDDPLSKLTHLFMWEIADLESLPGEYLCNLTSLRFLSIYKCPRLASLPPAMRQLTSLKTVHISDCPQLSQRCQKGVGEDWPNISHTSYAEPGERMIQFLRSELSQYNC
ncbi:Putative disease resistance protein RGA4 [Linum perenne]